MSLGNETVEILGPVPTDSNGDPIGEPTSTLVHGCNFQPRTSSETHDLSSTTITGYTLWAPPGTVVTATSRIRRPPGPGGRVYEVDGRPGEWSDLAGQPHHVQINLREVEG